MAGAGRINFHLNSAPLAPLHQPSVAVQEPDETPEAVKNILRNVAGMRELYHSVMEDGLAPTLRQRAGLGTAAAPTGTPRSETRPGLFGTTWNLPGLSGGLRPAGA